MVRRYDKERVITVTDKDKHKAEITKQTLKDRGEYKELQETLGKNAPSSFAEFIDLKYNKKEGIGMFKAYASSIKI